MRGIILAGATGSRLHPVTRAVSKHLLPVPDKPLIYYPLCMLMLAGIREVLVITTPHEVEAFDRLLGDGSEWGIAIDYAIQASPGGVAQAFLIGEDHIGDDDVTLVLGDSIVHGPGLGHMLRRLRGLDGAAVFAAPGTGPRADGVPGLSVYDNDVVAFAESLRPSTRGRLEITDLNRLFLEQGRLQVEELPQGSVWLDTRTFEAMHTAGEVVRSIERREGGKIGVPEETAWRMGFIDDEQLARCASRLIASDYGRYLMSLLDQREPVQRAG